MRPIKIGEISYTNILPVYHFIDRKKLAGKVEWIPQVPAQLNRHMAKGEIDLGPISSFAYAENHANYVVLSDLSISALGPVRSIFLFSKKPLHELKESKIALTNASATSVNLLRIMMEHFMEGKPSYYTMQPDLQLMMQQADAALLIGDDALLGKWKNTGYFVYDLGELWYGKTGMWMTFAVWAVRKETALQRPDLLARVHDAFLSSKLLGLERRDEVIAAARSSFGGSSDFWHTYYSGLSYDLSAEHIKGLEYYYQCAAEIGLLPQPVAVELWDKPSDIRSMPGDRAEIG